MQLELSSMAVMSKVLQSTCEGRDFHRGHLSEPVPSSLNGTSNLALEKTLLQELTELMQSVFKMIVDIGQSIIFSNPLVRLLSSVVYRSDAVEPEGSDFIAGSSDAVELEEPTSAVNSNDEVAPERGEQLKQQFKLKTEIQAIQTQISDCDIDIGNMQKEKGELEAGIRALEANIKAPVAKLQKSMNAHKGVKKNENSLWSCQQEAARKLEESEEHTAKLEQQSANLKQSKQPSLAQESIVGLSVRLMKLKEDLKDTNTKLSQRQDARKTLFSQLPEKKKELEAMAWRLIRPDCEDDMRQFHKEFSLKAVSCA